METEEDLLIGEGCRNIGSNRFLHVISSIVQMTGEEISRKGISFSEDSEVRGVSDLDSNRARVGEVGEE